MNTLKVCFYDFKLDKLVAVEDWKDLPDKIAMTSVLLAGHYQSGRHRMPSHIWVAFDLKDVLRIFHLNENPEVDEKLLNRIKDKVIEIRSREVAA
jgi:hypothetical protein